MPRGPAPQKKKRRTNTDAIPTTQLPAKGRKGRPPKVPEAYNLRKAGAAWWRWAWGTPQAAGWDPGALYVLARRAQLEDDLALQDSPFESTDFADLLGRDEDEVTRELEFVVGRLASMAGGRNPILKEMRELDKVLGLTPKAMVDLRWEIVSDEDAKPETASPLPTTADKKTADRKARLSLVKTATG
jgi:hypothetical protein